MPTVVCDPAKKRTHRTSHLQDILEMQQKAKEDALNAEKPMERSAAMRAWDVLEERRAILRGKPGSLTGRVEPQPAKRKSRAAPSSDHWEEPGQGAPPAKPQ